MLLAITTAALAGAQSTPATLDQLRADPDAFSGAIVQVAGQLDECSGSHCALCPIEATPAVPLRARCLSISLYRFPGDGGHGSNMDAAFRYADVVVTARFDPACLEGLCTDRASVLLDARVQDVTRRRRSRDGLITRPEPLRRVADADAAPLLALMNRGTPETPAPVRVFTTKATLGDTAVLCWSGPDEARAEWPSTFQGAISAKSTEDGYWCHFASRTEGAWHLYPQQSGSRSRLA